MAIEAIGTLISHLGARSRGRCCPAQRRCLSSATSPAFRPAKVPISRSVSAGWRNRLHRGRASPIEYRYANHRTSVCGRWQPSSSAKARRHRGGRRQQHGTAGQDIDIDDTDRLHQRLDRSRPASSRASTGPKRMSPGCSGLRPNSATSVEVLHELLPQAALIALLVDPNNPESVFYEQNALTPPARSGGGCSFSRPAPCARSTRRSQGSSSSARTP